MDYQLLNQTRVLVKKEIEKFLADFPNDHPYQMAMSLPHFRQRLETKIVSEVLYYGRVMPENGIELGSSQFAIKLLGEQLFIEDEICLMMPNIIQNTHVDITAAHPSETSYHLVTNLQAIIQNNSSNVCQFLNLKRKEIIGQHLLFFVPQWQWEKFYYYLDKIKKSTSNQEPTQSWSVQLETFQPQTLTRKLIDVEIENTVQRDCHGKMIGLHWLLHDLSQRYVNHQQNQQDVSAINWATCQAEAIAI